MEPIIILVSAIIVIGLLVVGYRQQMTLRALQRQILELSRTSVERQVGTEVTGPQQPDATELNLRQQILDLENNQALYEQKLADCEARISLLQSEADAGHQEAQQSKTLFSTIANVAYDAVFALDEEGIIIAHNQSSGGLFAGKNPIGEHFTSVINAPDLQDLINRSLNEDDSLEEQFVIDKRYYRARIRVMRYGENRHFMGVAMQDITQMVRLNRARRDMVANISHELRTPIANIRMIIEGLFHDQSRPKRKASIASLRAIARETESLQWTVQELLDLSMIESGQAIMKLVEEPLAEMVDEAVSRLKEKLKRKNLNVVRHVPRRMRVLCDREHIIRVFINLIGNAIKWSPVDDAITISAISEGEEITVTVFDNGPGVPDDQRERIFERFYQVDTARSGNEGSGLGLAICKHVIEAHGGVIWAEGNSQGSGGRFLFTLIQAESSTETDPYMDRGQHDVVLRPYVPQPPSVQNDYAYAMNNLDDDYEIEFVEEGDEPSQPE